MRRPGEDTLSVNAASFSQTPNAGSPRKKCSQPAQSSKPGTTRLKASRATTVVPAATKAIHAPEAARRHRHQNRELRLECQQAQKASGEAGPAVHVVDARSDHGTH